MGIKKFIYCKSGGDDALCITWEEEDLREFQKILNELPDGWSYELRLPNEEGKLSFFDVMLEWKREDEGNLWLLETGVFFKEADELRRTHASSFWSWDHAEALLRTHLDRIAKICSSPELTIEALKKMGTMLARRDHPLDSFL